MNRFEILIGKDNSSLLKKEAEVRKEVGLILCEMLIQVKNKINEEQNLRKEV
jgi:hypothetical protein